MTVFLIFLCLFSIAGAFLFAGFLRTRSLAAQAVATVPRAGQTKTVQGGSIHYVEMGRPDAPPLVLIHGLSGQLQHFTCAMTEDLERDFRVIVPDRPGCGYSSRDSDELATPAAQARMIWALLDALEVSQPVVAGHSLGGAVALAMALERPGQIRALALIAPLTHPMADRPEAFRGLQVRSPIMRRLLGYTLAVPTAYRTADKVLSQVFAPETCPESFLTDAGAALGLRPQAFITASADALAAEAAIPAQSRAYSRDNLPPGAVLFGEGDAILSPTVHGTPMQDHGYGLTILPGRGHMLPITAPAECNQLIREVAARAQSDPSQSAQV
jgi:pimeloyl-ACP methyl ester carboxylesterase